ncbi:relaxase domain-containing protein [Scleromatobacter humisilvae]|uniref:Relaxase domain-containing protein n=1 Tax=Scleromatobacter humisilvae TaxID=2897159 RepID=A0A9X1YLW6_9BURK|nr:relaxase domain-containing protein [Scleromatobacter humisilvae]MCK9687295.1 relaxase domain-containing protein [Scleromatobacter humisilvae]
MSIENERWMSIRKAADAVMHQTVAAGLQRCGIAYRITEHGVEIAAYSREHILRFSDGYKSVQRALEVKGLNMGTASGRAKEVANLDSRSETKRVVPLQAVQKMWLARAQAAGVPVFAPGDARLAQRALRQAPMTPKQAIAAVLDQVQLNEKRIHGDFALVREAIKCSGYATPHQEISREVIRQLQIGELVHTERGILRQNDATQVAKHSQAQVFFERRAGLAADMSQPGSSSLATPTLSSRLGAAQRAALLSALGNGHGIVSLSSAEAVGGLAATLVETADERGLRTVLVSSDTSDAGGVSFGAGVAASGSLDAGTLVVITDGSEHAESAAVIRAAAQRAGAVCIELELKAVVVKTMQPAVPEPVGSQANNQVQVSKLAQLASLVRRHGASLREAVSVQRHGDIESETQQRTQKL